MSENNPFEVPQQLRELTEANIKQAQNSYAQFMDAMVQASNMWQGAMPTNGATSGFKVVQERAVRFAKQNAEAGFALASELSAAKDVQEILAIQSRYAQTQMQAYTLQAQELGQLMMEASRNIQPK